MEHLPPKKHRDKVRARLKQVRDFLLSDPDRFIELMKRIGGFGEGKSALHNSVEAVKLLLDKEVPALIDSLDNIAAKCVGANKGGQDDEKHLRRTAEPGAGGG